jgi:lycopene beta-cyclase
MNTDSLPLSQAIRFPPPTDQPFDLVILGAGCAGLSLALYLSGNEDYTGRVLLVDRRACYQPDRTWCFFAPDDPALMPEALISHRWSLGLIRQGDRRVRLSLGDKPYVQIDAATFYAYALNRLENDQRFSLALGHSITDADILIQAGQTRISLKGHDYGARQMVDSRNDRLALDSHPRLWQIFFGMELETDEACFNPEEATLMDFLEYGQHPVEFLYTLPTATTRALVEYTVFTEACIDPASLQPGLEKAIIEQWGIRRYRVLRTEQGIIPMGMKSPKPDSTGRVRSGLVAGAARASTGYAFLRIQRWARACARQVHLHQQVSGFPADAPLSARMDDLFLTVLKQGLIPAPALFMALFQNTPTPALLRFLNDEATLADRARVIAALPGLPFLRGLAARK